ncbi:MAG: peroxiredoxin-like family protein [Stappiaceae bacterium]
MATDLIIESVPLMTADCSPLVPRQKVPSLSLPLVGGAPWSIHNAVFENFLLLVFYRGWHCPICRDQLKDLQSRLYDFERLGVSVVAVSTDQEDRATSTRTNWSLDRLSIAHGLSISQARQWGLYISTSRGQTSLGVEEPRQFNEPGLFLINPDHTLYYAATQSAPFARPQMRDVISAISFVIKHGYPARGEVLQP